MVAPYATALAAMIEPEAAVRNFDRLSEAGARGRYGFREALDYTPRRLPEGASVAIVKSYMAHHQGMALVALGNVLNDRRRWSSASTPTRSSRRPSCCSRSGCRATCSWRGRAPRR